MAASERRPLVTINTDGSVTQHGEHTWDEAVLLHLDRVERQAAINTLERAARLGRLKGSPQCVAELLGLPYP